MKTIKFFATVGVVAGYQGINNISNLEALEIVSKVWQEKAKEVFNKSQVYISAIISPSNAIYHTDWGCPVGGEIITSITGECNPEFVNVEKYKENVLDVLNLVKDELKQSTVQITFQEVELFYLK